MAGDRTPVWEKAPWKWLGTGPLTLLSLGSLEIHPVFLQRSGFPEKKMTMYSSLWKVSGTNDHRNQVQVFQKMPTALLCQTQPVTAASHITTISPSGPLYSGFFRKAGPKYFCHLSLCLYPYLVDYLCIDPYLHTERVFWISSQRTLPSIPKHIA